jgi:protein O-GlcNAc transferase
MAATSSLPQQVEHVLALLGQGRIEDAAVAIAALIAAHPYDAGLHNIAGAVEAGRGDLVAALACYDRAIARAPSFVDAHGNRGVALLRLGRWQDALDSFDRALRYRPDFVEAWSNRGIALKDMGRWEEALASQDQAIRHQPGFTPAWYNRAMALQRLHRLDEARDSFAAVLARRPDHADAAFGLGCVLYELGRPDEAVAQFDRALAIRPGFAAALGYRGDALHQLGRLDLAVESYRAALRFAPADSEMASRLLFLKAQMADWQPEPGLDPATLGIASGIVRPFNLLALDDSAERQLIRARNWARAQYPLSMSATHERPAGRPERLRIGYFSADFHDHATMALIGSLFAAHDRSRFEVHAFSFGPDRSDPMRARAVETADVFHDVRTRSDGEIAALARAVGIDIAVDLKGYTQDARPGIFAHGPAPVRIAWLGYPGTSGADFIDYIVADRLVIPPSQRGHYSEKLISLPASYQINDRLRPMAAAPADRAALGLPEDGFVFCCFNNSFKISAEAFAIWMRLLGRVDGSVLWLLRDNGWAAANLRRAAEAHGIDPARLVFADRVSAADHLARQAQADLFLDSFAYNAHTTASDALWMGVPLVTRLGESFASRVAGSLLHALDLPELATDSAEAYERLALELARDRGRLAALRERLAAQRLASPLFDTPRFVGDLERGFERAYDRWLAGLPPDHIDL